MANAGSRTRWDTPVSDAKSLAMVSLVDHNGLHVTLEDHRDPARRRYRISFLRFAAYRNIMEEYRTAESFDGLTAGWTVSITDSPWLEGLRESESLLDVYNPDCRHYRIETEDDVIDILSSDVPLINEIEPAAVGDPPPGKSEVLYDPEDREEIQRRLSDLGNDSGTKSN